MAGKFVPALSDVIAGLNGEVVDQTGKRAPGKSFTMVELILEYMTALIGSAGASTWTPQLGC